MKPLSVEFNTKQLLKRLGERQRSMMTNSPQLNEAFIRIGLRITTKAKLNIRQKKMIDRGGLFNSIRYEFFKEGDLGGVKIGSFGVPYAAINEFGGVVTRRMLRAMFAANAGRPPRASKNVIHISPGAETGTWRKRPYLIPALRSERDFITNTIATALGLK
jgi:hypothetical protein